ncbi:carbohydrate ABC transporter permease [Sanguibacter suaedae]|uniref:Carbohydrate ABC transporter permease n=1 Tax=Sanguibacter suaedae TaxID=2795737 RepID=A0A934M973_9MICO|nr:carbohydrate ABC transporter permease [Sanguibacter suaedae]MBI9114343.1 carbohydrate ABC transporter permease [Sanguibacter suaedae]
MTTPTIDRPGSTAEERTRAARPGAARRGGGSRVVLYVVLCGLALLFVAPIVWMISTSLKTQVDATVSTSLIPSPVTTGSFEPLLSWDSKDPVLRWFVNSVVVATVTTALVVTTAALAGYALARFRFRGRGLVFSMVVGTLFLPGFIFLIPNYIIVSNLGLLDTLTALVLPPVGGAFGVFFLRQFFLSLPDELDEAARLDGASDYQVFRSVMLPLAQAPLSTIAVITFLASWNDFLWPVYVLYTKTTLTLPAGLPLLQGAHHEDQPLIMAGAVIASVPALVVFVLAQRKIIESVATTGLKG